MLPIDLNPTKDELAELEQLVLVNEPSFEDTLRAMYAELVRDKRHETDLPCKTWDHQGCHCNHMPTEEIQERSCENHTDAHTGPAHKRQEGYDWCVVHQAACLGGRHQHISEEQFLRRYMPAYVSDEEDVSEQK